MIASRDMNLQRGKFLSKFWSLGVFFKNLKILNSSFFPKSNVVWKRKMYWDKWFISYGCLIDIFRESILQRLRSNFPSLERSSNNPKKIFRFLISIPFERDLNITRVLIQLTSFSHSYFSRYRFSKFPPWRNFWKITKSWKFSESYFIWKRKRLWD